MNGINLRQEAPPAQFTADFADFADFAGSNEKMFQNPLNVKNIGDPFIIKTNNTYYLYATSSDVGFYVWRSFDLINWEKLGLAFQKSDNLWCEKDFWAPEVVEKNNRFYMYYTARDKSGSLKIGVAVSPQPDSGFVDVYGSRPMFDCGYAAIDATVFLDGDEAYMYFSRDCSENVVDNIRKSEIYGVRLSSDLLSVVGEPKLLLTPCQPWELMSQNPLWNEGPACLKHNNKYYLSYSANYFGDSSYSVGYAVADSPLGNFIKAEENPIMTSVGRTDVSGTGHHNFIKSPDEKELFAVYHSHMYPEKGGERQANLDRVGFSEDGKLIINGPSTSPQPYPSSDKTACSNG